MDFEKFLRDILKKFQEGDSSKHYISGVFYGFFPYLLDNSENVLFKDDLRENVKWILRSF